MGTDGSSCASHPASRTVGCLGKDCASRTPSGGGAQAGHPGVIQSGEARGVISLVFPGNPPKWLPILELDYSTPRVSGVIYYEKESQKFG